MSTNKSNNLAPGQIAIVAFASDRGLNNGFTGKVRLIELQPAEKWAGEAHWMVEPLIKETGEEALFFPVSSVFSLD